MRINMELLIDDFEYIISFLHFLLSLVRDRYTSLD